MQTELARVIIALAVVIALVGAVGVVSAAMTTDATDASTHSGDGLVGHMTDGITEMDETAHMGEYTNGPMMEHMNNHEPGEHHTGNHHGEHQDGNHHSSGHGHC